jgi:hypothetical protein
MHDGSVDAVAREVAAMREELRVAEEARQCDADALKLQLSLLLEGHGETAEVSQPASPPAGRPAGQPYALVISCPSWM